MSHQFKLSTTLTAILWQGLLSPGFWLGLSLFGTVQAQRPTHGDDTSDLLRMLREHRFLNFRLISEYDPYHDNRLPIDADNPQFLALSADQRYVEYNAYDKQKGSWRLDRKGDAITLRAQVAATRGQTEAQTFKIKSFANRRLVLLWQGRHGYVERVYLLERSRPSD